MSFGNKRLDDAYDRWVTRSPYDYPDVCEECGKELTTDDDCGHDCEVK